MSTDVGYFCSCCGQQHAELPFSYGALAPAYWDENMKDGERTILGGEQCVIGGEQFYVRARLVLPVLDSPDEFDWGVWVSVSKPSFARICDLWTDPERIKEPPYFGWLATELPIYEPTTLNLKTRLQSQAIGVRPTIELEPTDHPLAVEQRTGITMARVQAIAEMLLHPQS
jgi:hypothetical protein